MALSCWVRADHVLYPLYFANRKRQSDPPEDHEARCCRADHKEEAFTVNQRPCLRRRVAAVVVAMFPLHVAADLLSFEAADFALNPIFSNVVTFQFSINIAEELIAGTAYTDPALINVEYKVSGTLAGTPSGFPAFALERSMGGAEFYAQGSSLAFEIKAGANLSDGLQVSELAGVDRVFLFDAREVGTGRYHPPIVELNADGTGLIRNSNNVGGINPATNMEVDVDYGEEYITELSFDPATLTLVDKVTVRIPVEITSFEIETLKTSN